MKPCHMAMLERLEACLVVTEIGASYMPVLLSAASVVPIIAVLLSYCRAFAPIPDVWKARKDGCLNEL